MSWVRSSSYKNKDRFFRVAAQPLCVLVKSYWSQRKWPGLDLLFAQGSCFPTFYRPHISFWLSMATSEIWGRAFKTDLSTCTSPTSLEGETVVWSHHVPFVRTHHPVWWKIPGSYFPLKYFPRKSQHPTKAKHMATSWARGKKHFVLWAATSVGKGCLLIFIFPPQLQLSYKLFNKEIRASH